MTILGLESSCDETAAALVKKEGNSTTLLANTVASSLTLHAATGGIIPEVAAREQLKCIVPVTRQAFREGLGWDIEKEKTAPPIDAIAVTIGPGLIGSLLVGVETARTLSYVWGKPLIPVNHLSGHIFANWIDTAGLSLLAKRDDLLPRHPRENEDLDSHFRENDNSEPRNDIIKFPVLALVVSGGHTDLVLMENYDELTVIGGTRDDAAGEAFDKIGRLLGLPYPAGPTISKLAEKGDPKAFKLPRPMIGTDDFDFSFSGLKTAVLNLIKKNGWEFNNVILGTSGTRTPESPNVKRSWTPIESGWTSQDDNNKQLLYNLSASVQHAIVDVLVKKTLNAAKKYKAKSILLGGGVAANESLRSSLQQMTNDQLPTTKLFAPAKSLCTDNAAMIAAAACLNFRPVPWEDITADPELYFNQPT